MWTAARGALLADDHGSVGTHWAVSRAVIVSVGAPLRWQIHQLFSSCMLLFGPFAGSWQFDCLATKSDCRLRFASNDVCTFHNIWQLCLCFHTTPFGPLALNTKSFQKLPPQQLKTLNHLKPQNSSLKNEQDGTKHYAFHAKSLQPPRWMLHWSGESGTPQESPTV